VVAAGQSVHAVWPILLAYDPAAHGVHGPPGGQNTLDYIDNLLCSTNQTALEKKLNMQCIH
jgi:hypothetical protein